MLFRLILGALLIAALNGLLARVARAQTKAVPVQLLPMPALVPPLPSLGFTPGVNPDSSATLAGGTLKPVDHRFLARLGRLLDGLRRPTFGRPGDTSGRNPTPARDLARDRDATSLGFRGVPISMSGAVFAGAGLGAAAAQFFDLAKIAKQLPLKVGPTLCQGGGGLTVKARW